MSQEWGKGDTPQIKYLGHFLRGYLLNEYSGYYTTFCFLRSCFLLLVPLPLRYKLTDELLCKHLYRRMEDSLLLQELASSHQLYGFPC